jgi:predicted site-specific integrase-resolvase
MWIKEAAKVANVSTTTIWRRIKDGRIRSTKMPNGKIMCWDDDVYAMIGRKLIRENWTVVYSRVNGTTESSKRLMKRQQEGIAQWCLQRGLTIDKVYEDWCVSTDFRAERRPGIHELLQDIMKKRVSVVIVETPDRLARVGFSLFPTLLRYYGVELVVINKAIQLEEYQKEQEADLLHLLKQAKVDRLGELEADPLPQPKKEIRTKGHDKELTRHPGKIVPDWDGAPDLGDLDLGDLM